jgi:hypothetical protein
MVSCEGVVVVARRRARIQVAVASVAESVPSVKLVVDTLGPPTRSLLVAS